MNEIFQTTETVGIVLSKTEQPCIYPILGALRPELEFGDELFKDSGAGDWLGFYDWLRTSAGEVIGVRLWIDEENNHLRAAGSCLNVFTDEKCFPFLIYFGGGREFEDVLSNDQDFGSNMLLLSAEKVALTFNVPRCV